MRGGRGGRGSGVVNEEALVAKLSDVISQKLDERVRAQDAEIARLSIRMASIREGSGREERAGTEPGARSGVVGEKQKPEVSTTAGASDGVTSLIAGPPPAIRTEGMAANLSHDQWK